MKRRKGCRMSCDVSEVTESLENEQSSFSKLSVPSPTSQIILPTLPLLHLRHSSFSNSSFASSPSQDFHLRHLASRPCLKTLRRRPNANTIISFVSIYTTVSENCNTRETCDRNVMYTTDYVHTVVINIQLELQNCTCDFNMV